MLAYTLLCGKYPFAGNVKLQQMTDEVNFDDMPADAPENLVQLIRDFMVIEYRDRPFIKQYINEHFAEDLEKLGLVQ